MFKPILKTFTIDLITYEASFKNNQISFYVVKDRSYLPEQYDPFEKWGSNEYAVDYGKVSTKFIFRVKKELLAFIKYILSHHKPPYFTFSGTSEAKNRVYLRVAEKLSREFGYTVYTDPSIRKISCYKSLDQSYFLGVTNKAA